MAATLQVIYPNADGTTFDHDYYQNTHLRIVSDCAGDLIESTLVTKGLAGGPDVPPGFHAIASILFANQADLEAAMGKLGPAIEDVPNFTNTEPQVLIGERI